VSVRGCGPERETRSDDENLLRDESWLALKDCEISLSIAAEPHESLRDEAERILRLSETRGITLRLLGGVAFGVRCPSASRPPLSRTYVDIDVIGHQKDSGKIKKLFDELGYKPRERFNVLQGTRLIFNDIKNSRRVDVFLDVFEMCHKFDFKKRMELDATTLPLADLLSTKLQIVEINEKDIKDILAMLLDHDLSGDGTKDTIDATYIAKLCAEDWGVYMTFTTNLGRVADSAGRIGMNEEQRARVSDRAKKLTDLIEETPKTMGWRMRAAVGERRKWYELPEPDREVVDSEATTGRRG